MIWYSENCSVLLNYCLWICIRNLWVWFNFLYSHALEVFLYISLKETDVRNVTKRCMELFKFIIVETLLYASAVSPFSQSRRGLRTVPESPEIMTPPHCQWIAAAPALGVPNASLPPSPFPLAGENKCSFLLQLLTSSYHHRSAVASFSVVGRSTNPHPDVNTSVLFPDNCVIPTWKTARDIHIVRLL